jgi:UDP-N-acetylmuramoyl-tripeptide--D-alanyl-D-alanine ligase
VTADNARSRLAATSGDLGGGTDDDAADLVSMMADDLVSWTGGRLIARSPRPIRGGAVDSRVVEPGQLFVALPGERTDGHTYLPEAIERGAAAVIVTRPPADPGALGDVSVVRVVDATVALGSIAAAWRRRFNPLVVGVTGSIAKTSTKEAIATVLETGFETLRTTGNQNNEIGLPLTLLRLGPEHEAVVLEMGMYVGGEIAELAAIARPSIGVVTAVQAVHLSRIGSLEAVERAKGELIESLPANGTAILNADDPLVDRMDRLTGARTLRYGFKRHADVRADDVESRGLAGMRFTLCTPSDRTTVELPGLGRLSVHNALAAAAVGVAAGLATASIVAGLQRGWSAPHRAEIVRLAGIDIVDDSYNASPGSVVAALELLGGLPGRHVAVLGEMLELGEAHEAGHIQVGEAAADIADLLIVVGHDARGIVDGAIEGGMERRHIHHVADHDDALEVLRPRLRDGDTILVKASRGVGLDRLVVALRREIGEPDR